MSIKVQLPNRHPLNVSTEGAILPEIVLTPTPDNVPHLRRITFTVTGQPPHFVQAIQGAFKDRFFKDPHRLAGPASLGKPHVQEEVPQDVEIVLDVQVHYYDSDGAGQPPKAAPEGVADPKLKTAKASCILVPGCMVRVEPDELQVMEGGNQVTLRIQVERGPADARPRVRVKNPDALPHPQIRQKLVDAFNVTPQRVAATESHSTSTRHRPAVGQRGAAVVYRQSTEQELLCFELLLQIQLSEEAKKALLSATNKGPLRVPLVTEVPGGGQTEHSLFLKCNEKPHPGWLAIDFGTTNSTVTLFDPKFVATDTGLPAAQEIFLRRALEDWLARPPSDALPGVAASDWLGLLAQVGRNLGGGQATLATVVREGKLEQLSEALRQLEICVLAAGAELLARAATSKLQEIYHAMLRVPPLESKQLVPIELERGKKKPEVLSEMEITDLGPPVHVLMGDRAKQDRLQALATARDADVRLAVSRRFHHSPKRYLGKEMPIYVHVKDQTSRLTASKLVQAAWNHLLELTDEYRQDNLPRLSIGAFNHVVVTYPTVAPPTVRREVERLVGDLGVRLVQTDYDEAVSAAMFFLWREFGDVTGVGLEAFKARSRPHGDNQWVQNVLVFDIGGGTTDLALIRLILEEKDPFEPGEDRGLGGRYYVIRPTLLGSSGEMHLGGDLITLKLFLLLKAVIADHVLTLAQQGKISCEKLSSKVSELEPPFVDDNGKYRPRSLLDAVEKAEQQNRHDLAALDAIDKVIPTRWERDIDRLQAFYTLWEYVDAPEVRAGAKATGADVRLSGGAKIHLGRRRESEGEQTAPFVLAGDKVLDLLRQCGYEIATDAKLLQVRLSYPQFERAVYPVISEAVKIADSLMMRLPPGKDECIDWLILSGKTCNLEMVEQEIRRVFGWSDKSDKKFTWNRERVTFVPEYAKLATSIGACYAERVRQVGFRAEDSKPMLRAGVSQVDIDVKNLFVNLPCMFTLGEVGVEPLFTFGQELSLLDDGPLFKARTGWRPLALTLNVYRQNSSTAVAERKIHWGTFKAEEILPGVLDWTPAELKDRLEVQFEVDHRLEMKLYLRHKDLHYHDVSGKTPIDLQAVLSSQSLPSALPAGKGQSAQAAPVKLPVQLEWEIAVNVMETSGTNQAFVVFKQGQKYDKPFVLDGNQTCYGLISVPLPPFPRNRKHTLYARQNGGEWKRIGELAQQGDVKNPPPHRLSLDQHGRLRLHLGEVPYRLAVQPSDFRHPGVVYATTLELLEAKVNEDRDPFCGRH